jgi:hypothetical protein
MQQVRVWYTQLSDPAQLLVSFAYTPDFFFLVRSSVPLRTADSYTGRPAEVAAGGHISHCTQSPNAEASRVCCVVT